MKKLALVVLLSFCAIAAKQDPTANFVAYLAKLQEQGAVIDDDALLKIIEGADRGEIVNPVQPTKSVAHHLAYKNLNQIKKGVDARLLGEWCVKNLKDQERVRERREKTAEETKMAWKPQTNRFSAGLCYNCALRTNGTVACWGDNREGQSTVPAELGPVHQVKTQYQHTCALKIDNTAECWGNNKDGQAAVPGKMKQFQSIAVGWYHTCAIDFDGTVVCWGGNCDNQLKVPMNLGPVQSISAGGNNTCAVKLDGNVVCWGKHIANFSMFPPSDLGRVQSIAVGRDYACAVKLDGTGRCWGDNANLQIPDDLGLVRSISANWDHLCVITVGDKIACWGERSIAEVPSSLGPVQSVSTGVDHACALKMDNTVFCWGDSKGFGAKFGALNVPDAINGPTIGPTIVNAIESWLGGFLNMGWL